MRHGKACWTRAHSLGLRCSVSLTTRIRGIVPVHVFVTRGAKYLPRIECILQLVQCKGYSAAEYARDAKYVYKSTQYVAHVRAPWERYQSTLHGNVIVRAPWERYQYAGPRTVYVFRIPGIYQFSRIEWRIFA